MKKQVFGGLSQVGSKNIPLPRLVEQYLADNSNLSFINIDDMVDCLRTKCFKYQRLQRTVFFNQVKSAYFEYVKRQKNGQGNNGNATPASPQVSSEPSMIDDDSDIEEISEERPPPAVPQDFVSSTLTALYKNNNKPAQSQQQPGTTPEKVVSTIETADSSSAPAPVPCDQSVIVNVNASNANTTNPSAEEDSDDDLEILEEVRAPVRPHFSTSQPSTSSSTMNGAINAVPSGITVTMLNQNENWIDCNQTHFQNAQRITEKTFTLTTLPRSRPLAPPIIHQHQPSSAPIIRMRTEEMDTGTGSSNPPKSPSPASKRGRKRKNDHESSSQGNEEEKLHGSKKLRKDVIRDSGIRLCDFAGSEKVVEEVCKLIMHLKHPEVYTTLGVKAPRGFLLHGPPGTGKTLLANAIAGELELPMLKVTGTEFVSGISGESESNIRDLFAQAASIAPSIIFIDEIDSITPKRESAGKEMERRMVTQLLSCIDGLTNHEKGDQVLLIGATNRVEAIDTALRRAGRFDREICLGIPDEGSREKILNVICKNLRLAPGFDLSALAKLTPGYVGADLQLLVREAAVAAVNKALNNISGNYEKEVAADNPVIVSVMSTCTAEQAQELDDDWIVADIIDKLKRRVEEELLLNVNGRPHEEDMDTSEFETAPEEVPIDVEEIQIVDSYSTEPQYLRWIKESYPLSQNDLDSLYIFMDDFEEALKHVQPSSKREGFATVPDTTWDDVGALKDIREELEVSILGPVKHSLAFASLGLTNPAGVLLCGPPGCGKTLLAKAVANEARINFISVKGPELLNMYVGESERAVRQCFIRAKSSSPCVIFFDEIDALCPRRSDGPESGSGSRIVNQLLTEMDGIEGRGGVFIMAATNRPDILDPAILRPGRLDKILFVDLPTPTDRYEIFKAITKNGTKPALSSDVNLESLAQSKECEFYTGADLAALVREASVAAFKELVLESTSGWKVEDLKVSLRHFTSAFGKTRPSVTKVDREKYAVMKNRYSATSTSER